jgi:hypothetical protein
LTDQMGFILVIITSGIGILVIGFLAFYIYDKMKARNNLNPRKESPKTPGRKSHHTQAAVVTPEPQAVITAPIEPAAKPARKYMKPNAILWKHPENGGGNYFVYEEPRTGQTTHRYREHFWSDPIDIFLFYEDKVVTEKKILIEPRIKARATKTEEPAQPPEPKYRVEKITEYKIKPYIHQSGKEDRTPQGLFELINWKAIDEFYAELENKISDVFKTSAMVITSIACIVMIYLLVA